MRVMLVTLAVCCLWSGIAIAQTTDVQPEAPPAEQAQTTDIDWGEPAVQGWGEADGAYMGQQAPRGGFMLFPICTALFALFALLASVIAPPIVSYYLASEKGLSPVPWVILGLIPGVGFYTLLYLVGTPRSKHAPSPAEATAANRALTA